MGSGEESGEPYHFFQRRNGIVAVDLQWMMARRHFGFRLDRSAFWGRLKPVHLPTKSVMGLCPEDLLILLCVHGAKHAWEQLKWVCDVAELVRRRPALDWSRVLFQAGEWRCRRLVLLGLAMAHSLFDTAVPLTILQEIETDADIPVLVRKMPKQLLKNPRHGIDEDCAEALYMTLKDSWLERWKLGVALCRAEAEGAHPFVALVPVSTGTSYAGHLFEAVSSDYRQMDSFCPNAGSSRAVVAELQLIVGFPT
jgi:hypothetical protein